MKENVDERSEKKNRCADWESGGHCKSPPPPPSGVQGRSPGKFWLFCILNRSKMVICLFLDELLFTLLRVGGLSLGSQTDIPASK